MEQTSLMPSNRKSYVVGKFTFDLGRFQFDCENSKTEFEVAVFLNFVRPVLAASLRSPFALFASLNPPPLTTVHK